MGFAEGATGNDPSVSRAVGHGRGQGPRHPETSPWAQPPCPRGVPLSLSPLSTGHCALGSGHGACGEGGAAALGTAAWFPATPFPGISCKEPSGFGSLVGEGFRGSGTLAALGLSSGCSQDNDGFPQGRGASAHPRHGGTGWHIGARARSKAQFTHPYAEGSEGTWDGHLARSNLGYTPDPSASSQSSVSPPGAWPSLPAALTPTVSPFCAPILPSLLTVSTPRPPISPPCPRSAPTAPTTCQQAWFLILLFFLF